MDEGYRRLLHKALAHRPWVVIIAAASVVVAAVILPTLPTELSTQTDEGQVQVNVELAQGTRIEVTDPVLRRVETALHDLVPEAEDVITAAGVGGPGFGGFGAPSLNRGNLTILLKPKDERSRSSEQIAMELRRQLSGIPGVIVRANASGGNNQLNRFLSGGNQGGGRLALEIRGECLEDAQKVALAAKDLLDTVPGIADARLGRDEGRPELAVRIDRAKAALLGVSATQLAETIRTNVAGEQAAMYRTGGNEYPIIVRLREDERQNVRDVNDVLISLPQGRVLPAKNLMRVEDAVGPVRIER
jgi:HAE1 family hydrophobic/amphiphilic exporter-1